MDYRNLLGISAIIASTALLIQVLRPANASLPVGMQHGQFPYENKTNCDIVGAIQMGGYCQLNSSLSGTVANLISVPTDRMFVITGVTTYSSFCFVEVDGVPIDKNLTNFRNTWMTPFKQGTVHFAVDPGASVDLNIYSTASNCSFYLEGYYAHP